MSALHWAQTIIEIAVVIALLAGFFYEPTLALWESRQKEKILKAFKKRKVNRK